MANISKALLKRGGKEGLRPEISIPSTAQRTKNSLNFHFLIFET